MIETDFFILTGEQYQQFNSEASELGLSIDYYLSEFCDVEGPDIYID
jgi:hypothetical protein